MEYQHGGDIYSYPISWDFSTNINPYGMPESVRNAIVEAVSVCSQYPDSRCGKLRESLSEWHNVNAENIICGNGAADLIFQAVQAQKPVKALIPAPTFSEYEQALKSVGCNIEYCCLEEKEGFFLNAHTMLKHLDASFDVLFLCNPNNPTGCLIKKQDLEEIISYCKHRDIFLFLDECFLDFTGQEASLSLLPLIEKYDNLMILKAFTKMYGMAGVRLGYAITANRKLIETMELSRQPWSVSTLAQSAGLAAMKEEENVKKVRKLLLTERPYLKKELENLGFFVYDSSANYLLFSDYKNAQERQLFSECRQKGLLIRWCGNYHGLSGHHYRVCIKRREENKILITILGEVLKER